MEQKKTDYRAEAHALIASGISVGPLKIDGSKMPKIRWSNYNDRFMTHAEVEEHFLECGGIFAITGAISKLLLLDFDTKYDYDDEDTFINFMKQVPEALKAKMTINRTRSGGYHGWCRTNYTDKSRKITRRLLTLSELTERVRDIVDMGGNEKSALSIIMKSPYEVTLETRGDRSYGCLIHESYTPVQKSNGEMVTEDEMEFLLGIGYGLDCGFNKKPPPYVGEENDYKYIVRFNDDATMEGVVGMLNMSGLYQGNGLDHNGNTLLKRVGSSANHSGYVYQTGITKLFGTNLFECGKDTLDAFTVYCEINNFTKGQAIKKIKEKYAER